MHGFSDINNSLVVQIVADILTTVVSSVLYQLYLGCPHLVGRRLVSAVEHVVSEVDEDTFI